MASLFSTIREWGGRLAITCGVLFFLVSCFVIGALLYGAGLPFARSLQWEHTPAGLSDTLDYFLAGDYPYLPRDVILSDLLREMGPQYGFLQYDIQAMVAGARRMGIQPEHIVGIQMNARLEGGFRDMYPLALAIGQFLAQNGYHDPPVICPTPMPEIEDLPTLSPEETPELPCVELNPKHEAIKALNPDGGEGWLSRVLSTASTWEGPLQTVEVEPTKPLTILHQISVLIEMVRLREAGYYSELVLVDRNPVILTSPGQAPIPYPDVPDGYFIHPYDGSSLSGNCFGCEVYVDGKVIFHPGVDLNHRGGAVVAACNGRVTYAGWMNSATLWISGVVVVIECNPNPLDPTPICTLYGHGVNGSLKVGADQNVKAGTWLFDAGNTGYSFGVHLHYAIRVGGGGPFCNQAIDPMPYLP